MPSIWDYITPGLTDEQKRQALQAAQVSAKSLQRTPQALMDMFSQQLPEGALQAKYNIDPQQAIGMGMEAMFAAPAGITAWHGSPFKFGAFDASKIGSGEGAQAYGYGHYFAENPSVAKEYSKISQSGGAIQSPLRFINGVEVFPGTGAYKAASLLDSLTLPQARKLAAGWQKNAGPDDFGYFNDVYDTLDLIKRKSSVKQKPPGGNVYKVDIPDDQVANMLNWNQEIGKQSRQIQDLAKQHGLAMDDLGGDLVAAMDAKRAAGAEAMRQAGVPGIRYLDQQSRGGVQAGTENLVVFPGNEGLIKMLEMNDKPMSYWGF